MIMRPPGSVRGEFYQLPRIDGARSRAAEGIRWIDWGFDATPGIGNSASDRRGASDRLMRAGSLCQRRPSAAARAGGFGLRADDAIRAPLLDRMREPSARATDREGRCEQSDIKPQAVEQKLRIELDVRLQASPG